MLQTARADAVRALLVFLNLLERQAERVRDLALAHVEHEAPHAQASADVFVDGVDHPANPANWALRPHDAGVRAQGKRSRRRLPSERLPSKAGDLHPHHMRGVQLCCYEPVEHQAGKEGDREPVREHESFGAAARASCKHSKGAHPLSGCCRQLIKLQRSRPVPPACARRSVPAMYHRASHLDGRNRHAQHLTL